MEEHVTSIFRTCYKHVSNKHYASILRVLSEYATSMMRARYEHDIDAIILRALGEQVTRMMRACHQQDASILRARCKPVMSTKYACYKHSASTMREYNEYDASI